MLVALGVILALASVSVDVVAVFSVVAVLAVALMPAGQMMEIDRIRWTPTATS